MKEKKPTIYRWQPELATSIIYWSFTFGILFVSLIFTLEKTHIYLGSIIIFLFFLLFVYLGSRRCFRIEGQQLVIQAALRINKETIDLNSIEQIRIDEKTITIDSPQLKYQSKNFLMTKKTKISFIDVIKQHKEMLGTIIEQPMQDK